MKKILLSSFILWALCGVGVSFAASPDYVLETAPYTNVVPATGDVAAATASVSAVTVSSFTITKVDTAFNAAALSALGTAYQRVEVTMQNNDTTDKFCGFSASAVTIANSYKIAVGATWSFKLGKGVGVYCLNAAGSSGTLIVGGVAWK